MGKTEPEAEPEHIEHREVHISHWFFALALLIRDRYSAFQIEPIDADPKIYIDKWSHVRKSIRYRASDDIWNDTQENVMMVLQRPRRTWTDD